MFKFLFKVFVLPILILAALVGTFLFFLYKNVSIPTNDFAGTQTVDFTSMVTERVDIFLADNSNEASVDFNFTQQQANQLILEQLRTQNPSYQDANAPDDQKNYVLKQDYFGYQGSWVRLKNGSIEIESGAHVFVGGFTFKTALLLTFELEANTDEVVLRLTKLNIGKIPLAWASSVANWGLGLAGIDIEQQLEDQLGGFATFDLSKRELKLDVDALVEDQFSDNPQQAALIGTLLHFIESNELLNIGFGNQTFGANLNLGKSRDNTVPFVLDEADKIEDEAHFQAILAAKTSGMIFSVLDTNSEYAYIDLDVFTLNRMFEYLLRDAQVGNGVLQEVELFDEYTLSAFVPFVTVVGNNFYINIPLSIIKNSDSALAYHTIIKLHANPVMEGSDLRLELEHLSMGEVTLEGEHIGSILGLLGETDFVQDGALVIKDFDQQMTQAGLQIRSVEAGVFGLRLFVELNDSLPFSQIADAIQNALSDIADNPDYPQELNDAINNLLDALADDDADTNAAVEALLEEMQNLDDDTQTELFANLETALADEDVSLEDIFDLNP